MYDGERVNVAHQFRYNRPAVILHWVSALCIFALFVIGPIMKRAPIDLLWKFELYQLHKSIGVVVFALTAVRLARRICYAVPDYEATLAIWERRAARLVHWLFYALLIIIPFSGWAVVSTAALKVPTLIFGIFQLPHVPFLVDRADVLRNLTLWLHSLLGLALFGLVVLHVTAALRHHFVLKDSILFRMLPWDRKRERERS